MSKRGRGRPPKIAPPALDCVQDKYETRRTAYNRNAGYTALLEIMHNCPESTQRYFYGGITPAEEKAGMKIKRCFRNYVMQELGRHPQEEIAGMADAIANNRTFDTWTQKDIVDFLKDLRLHRTKGRSAPTQLNRER